MCSVVHYNIPNRGSKEKIGVKTEATDSNGLPGFACGYAACYNPSLVIAPARGV